MNARESLGSGHSQWVGEALASLFKATEVAPTLISDYSTAAVHLLPPPRGGIQMFLARIWKRGFQILGVRYNL
jgi:hypothetical protein